MKKIILIIALLINHVAHAADGDLDPTFGTGGIVITGMGGTDDSIHAIALQPDKKIIAAGFNGPTADHDFAIVRYNNDGSLDRTFGSGGKKTLVLGPNKDEIRAVVLRKDGKIIAAGFSEQTGKKEFALTRCNPDGTLDTSFGDNGIVTTTMIGTNNQANAVVLQPDNKVIAIGDVDNNINFALIRYNPDGSLDSTFGNGGIVITDVAGDDDLLFAAELQADGKIVVAGIAGSDFAVARYNSNGTLDTSFGTNGIVTTTFSAGNDQANALVIQLDGKIIVAGFAGATSNFAVARYNPDGSLDSSFGIGGKLTTAVSANSDRAEAVILQPDGKIVAAGFSGGSGTDLFALVRYNSIGTLDSSFGTGGIITTSLGLNDDQALAAVVGANGSILTAGFSDQTVKLFALARYLIPSVEVSTAAEALRAKYFLLQRP